MKRLFLLIALIIMIFPAGLSAKGEYKYKDRAEFDSIFNDIARNFGAVQSAYYTFTLEYNGIATNLQEMVDTGHLRVTLKNPYTGMPIHGTFTKEIGEINWTIMNEGEFIRVETYWQDWNDPENVKYFSNYVYPYNNEILQEIVFSDDLTREEQLVRVYCLQFVDALEGYEQRFGAMPESFEELKKGDFNVSYLNPVTGKLVVNSDKLSPGDFWYKKLSDDHYFLVGWGLDGPVHFESNDRSIDEFIWDGETGSNQNPVENIELYE